jgi:hypothetical protein
LHGDSFPAYVAECSAVMVAECSTVMFLVLKKNMSIVDELFAYAALAYVLQNRKQKRKRKLWTKPWLERNNFTHIDLLQELKCFPKDWSNYLRMDESTYLQLLSMVTPYINKEDTNMRKAITPNERLTATLRCTRTVFVIGFSSPYS